MIFWYFHLSNLSVNDFIDKNEEWITVNKMRFCRGNDFEWSLKILIRKNRTSSRLPAMHYAFGSSARPRTLEFSHTWFKGPDFTHSTIRALSIFLIIDFFFPLFPINVVFDKRCQYFFLVHILRPERCNIRDLIVRLEHSSLDESSLMNIFGIEHNQFLLLVAVLFEYIHLNFEVLFIERLIGRKVALCIEWYWFGVLKVLLLWRSDFFRSRLGLFVGWLGFEHCT